MTSYLIIYDFISISSQLVALTVLRINEFLNTLYVQISTLGYFQYKSKTFITKVI